MTPYQCATAAIAAALLLSGCGNNRAPQPKAHNFPALNESPPPVMPKLAEQPPPLLPPPPQGTILGDGWLERQLRHEAIIQSLRDYAANADEDDQFKLSEEAISELEKDPDICGL